MKKLIIASNNEHKINEIKKILEGTKLEIKSLKEENIFIDVLEDGKTFEENSKKKCMAIAEFLKSQNKQEFIVMADDSGLEVEYLGGAPGIYSARYAGVHGDDKKNNEKLLAELNGVDRKDRKAKFVCQISVVDDKGVYNSVRGEAEGIILNELVGNSGFGYDPLFYYEPLKKTFADISPKEKNKVSHRAVALRKIKKIISIYLD